MKDHDSRLIEKGGYSRRAFLKGSGAAAAATALATGAGLADAAQASGSEVVKGETDVTLNVNGQDYTIKVEPRMTLLEALRHRIGLTGAKPVDSDGVSGADTVWVDDKLHAASTSLALDCVGKKIRTVESLGGSDPDEVPLAFLKHDAQQCGFCTPGFVVAVRAFLDKNPDASESEIRAGLNGNICRCGTYANVVQAALDVVKGGS
jgi:xanthine dehydrogenase YagT iron-sulfur-binding subunit